MKATFIVACLALVAMPPALKEWTRSSNSRASTARGIAQYDAKKHAKSARSFASAEEIDGGPVARYNLGTARVAAGDGIRAAADFSDAIRDDALATDAFFNRGSAALKSKARDDAIRDFSDTLRRNPADSGAKRNLEIALRNKQREDEQRRQQQQPSGAPEKPKDDEAGKGDPKPGGGMDVDSLLRSVRQQEQEELSRMRRPTSTRGRNW